MVCSIHLDVKLLLIQLAGCLTRYHPNYYVHHPSGSNPKRKYYHGIPEYIQVKTHSFVERALCTFFEIEMAISQCVTS